MVKDARLDAALPREEPSYAACMPYSVGYIRIMIDIETPEA